LNIFFPGDLRFPRIFGNKTPSSCVSAFLGVRERRGWRGRERVIKCAYAERHWTFAPLANERALAPSTTASPPSPFPLLPPFSFNEWPVDSLFKVTKHLLSFFSFLKIGLKSDFQLISVQLVHLFLVLGTKNIQLVPNPGIDSDLLQKN